MGRQFAMLLSAELQSHGQCLCHQHVYYEVMHLVLLVSGLVASFWALESIVWLKTFSS